MPVVSDYRAIVASLDNVNRVWNANDARQFPVFVTYSFYEAGDLPTASQMPYSVAGTTVFSPAQRTAFRDALAVFEKVTGIKFVETTGDAMIRAHGVTGSMWGGWAYYPFASESYTRSSDIVLDVTRGPLLTGFDFQIILHEIGHALGLSHPHEGSYTLQSSVDNTLQTVMSYNWSSTPTNGLGPIDKVALDYLYGGAMDLAGWNYGFSGNVFTVTGAAGDDLIMGVAARNTLKGRGGDDALVGREFDDKLLGDDGNDTLKGKYGSDVLRGGPGQDTLDGGQGNDKLLGGGGDDILRAGPSHWLDPGDTLFGGLGNDSLVGNGTDNTLVGGKGDDTLVGKYGNDDLSGRAGNDVLEGGQHRDTLAGGPGDDTMTGGLGADTFLFLPGDRRGTDTITDFELATDRLDVSATVFTASDAALTSAAGGTGTLVSFAGPAGFDILLQSVALQDALGAQAAGDLFA